MTSFQLGETLRKTWLRSTAKAAFVTSATNLGASATFQPQLYLRDGSANTIVVIGKADPPRFAACVVLAPNRLDVNRTVRDRIGTRKASFAPAELTRELTGMEIGGVTVFGLPEDLPIWVDARVMTRERIVLGGGSRSWKVIADPRILLALPNVTVVDGLAGDPRPETDA